MRGTNVQRQMLGNGWEENKLPAGIHGRGKPFVGQQDPASSSGNFVPAYATGKSRASSKVGDRLGGLKDCLCPWRAPGFIPKQPGGSCWSSYGYPSYRPSGNFLPGHGSDAWLRKEPKSPSTPTVPHMGLRETTWPARLMTPFHPLVYHHPARARRSHGLEGSSHMQSPTSPLAAQTQPGVSCSRRTEGRWTRVKEGREVRRLRGAHSPLPGASSVC